jgi:cell division septal protein FtsQ
MWFKRKPKNRRLGREQVLDVRLRSSQVRAARRRMLGVSLGMIFTVAFGVLLVWRAGQWVLNRLVYENSAFNIETIDIQTDGDIALEQLRRWSSVRPGQNLFALDLAGVRRNLLLVSRIQTASVERVLPHTLRVRVVEREPLAQLSVPRPKPDGRVEMATFQLDPEAYVLVPLDPHQRTGTASPASDELPTITGVKYNEVQPGSRIDSPQVKAALELLRAFEHSPMEGVSEIQRIDVSSPDAIAAATAQGSAITFGLSDFDQQLRRWHEIFLLGQKLGRAIATLDLAVTNNIPASWLEASAVPPTPKSPKPLHSRKKHV